ncbi:unnamed protein product [Scytosiphon promiscuus]
MNGGKTGLYHTPALVDGHVDRRSRLLSGWAAFSCRVQQLQTCLCCVVLLLHRWLTDMFLFQPPEKTRVPPQDRPVCGSALLPSRRMARVRVVLCERGLHTHLVQQVDRAKSNQERLRTDGTVRSL